MDALAEKISMEELGNWNWNMDCVAVESEPEMYLAVKVTLYIDIAIDIVHSVAKPLYVD